MRMTMNRKATANTDGKRRSRERGQSMIEAVLMAPWIFLLFMAIFNIGFYSYALIAVENSARIAALFASQTTSGSDNEKSIQACRRMLAELANLPNLASETGATCPDTTVLDVSVVTLDADQSADRLEKAVRLTATYQSIQLFLLPGIADNLLITRVVEMRLKTGGPTT